MKTKIKPLLTAALAITGGGGLTLGAIAPGLPNLASAPALGPPTAIPTNQIRNAGALRIELRSKSVLDGSAPIPWGRLGTKAGADYKGDGLAMTPTESGARLRCLFQRLEGAATPEGLWLTSTVTNSASDRFRVKATVVGRVTPCAPTSANELNGGQRTAPPATTLAAIGTVQVADKLVRFIRPGLIEEYSVSMAGVRQDFLVLEKPVPPLNSQATTINSPLGELRVELEVTGALVESAADDAQLVLPKSGRKIAYSRLRVTDATGKELPARMEVMGSARVHLAGSGVAPEPSSAARSEAVSGQNGGETNSRHGAENDTPEACAPLLVVVDDTEAVYPLRIDPTLSDANWISLGGFPGTDGVGTVGAPAVYALVLDASGNLYIAGSFSIAGNSLANNIAKWDGTNWSALGSGLGPGAMYNVYALAVSGSDLYAGGDFNTANGAPANGIAKWNGSRWTAVGGMNAIVHALVVSGSDLYAGGYFISGGALVGMAKWNGSSWSALGSGVNGFVYALAVSGSNVYAAGSFTMAGGVAADSIAQWNGSSWSALGEGITNGQVNALAVLGSDLYVGGSFTKADRVNANNIAKWDGSSWSAVGKKGISGTVNALAVSGSSLYAGGTFYSAGAGAASFIAEWDGSSWSALGSGMSYYVNALAVSGSNVYAGGSFWEAGGVPADSIAKWNGSSWSALLGSRSGLNGDVLALAVSGSNVYAGGYFTVAGGSNANYIARWDGSSWTTLGAGMNGSVTALAVSGSDLYAGGSFTTAGGSNANYIAKWNGSSWSALGPGMSSQVYALAVSGSDLYAAGDFTIAGGSNANFVAKWNGSSWSALGSGLGPAISYTHVYALAVSGSDLYAGGSFTTAGGVAASSVARWDGSGWSALGEGITNGWVSALAVSGSNLYVGGGFYSAGGVAANYIAKWDGSSWSALGSGVDGQVYALAVSGGDLYAGGHFATAGGVAASGIARWDGSSWSALGSGMESDVDALAASDDVLYAGGAFSTAGGKVSPGAAEAILLWPEITRGPQPNPDGSITLNLLTASNVPSRLYWSTNLTPPALWRPIYTNLTGGLWQFTDTNTAAFQSKFYRLSTP
jgi:hypothetical protein